MQAQTRPWPFWQRVSFQFFFIFFLLFVVLENNGAFPFFDWFMTFPTKLLGHFIPWIGKYILNISYQINTAPSGSSDTTYFYIVYLLIAVCSLCGSIIWLFLDHNRSNFDKLYYWLSVVVRYYVGLTMMNYALYKIFKTQFPAPGIHLLVQPFGDSSPMGLAWRFFGFSYGYNLFLGVVEFCSVLLLFRRTIVLGALITISTTINIMAVNYFYDVCVKTLSVALVAMTLFLLLPYAEQLFNFFFRGESVSLRPVSIPDVTMKWKRTMRVIFKSLFIGSALMLNSYELIQIIHQRGDFAPKPTLYGVYNVDRFVLNKDTIPPLLTKEHRWRQLIIPAETAGRVRYMNDSLDRFTIKVDTALKTLSLRLRSDTSKKSFFSYQFMAPEQFQLIGTINGDSASVFFKTRKDDAKNFRLTKRGIHWVTESPYSY